MSKKANGHQINGHLRVYPDEASIFVILSKAAIRTVTNSIPLYLVLLSIYRLASKFTNTGQE
jgi:hypothetical protein